MDHGEKRAKAKSIILEVDETNKAAISVYRKRGYETFGYYPGYYGKTGALRMKKVF
jgi:ribosomal protein S18 acetylase RimI-like enzyme